ncbi:MAG TPA: hypothetical protein VHX18_09105 [Rhizomicrobium sp.]|nr:hypothetical protein [Rhizomicrobium sp.]
MKNIGFIGLCMLLAAGAAQADPRDDALSAMLRCSGISEKPQRLVCYDTTVVRIPDALNRAAPPPSSSTVASAVPPPAAPVAPRRQHSSSFVDKLFGPDGPKRAPQTTAADFGSESVANGGREAYPIPMDGDTIDQISARLVNYQFLDGYLIATLDNGQMWRETADGEPLQHLARSALSYTVVIGRAGGGSYAMKLTGVAREIPVRRIR